MRLVDPIPHPVANPLFDSLFIFPSWLLNERSPLKALQNVVSGSLQKVSQLLGDTLKSLIQHKYQSCDNFLLTPQKVVIDNTNQITFMRYQFQFNDSTNIK